MMDAVLFYIHHALTLLLGVLLSAAYCGVRFTRKTIIKTTAVFAVCGINEISTLLISSSEITVWKFYPLIVHLPLIILLCLVFKKRPGTAIASVMLAYLCCQPSNWFGILSGALTDNTTVIMCVKIVVAAIVTFALLKYFAAYIASIFNKDTRSVVIFGIVPLIYYLFDYIVGIYTDLWNSHSRLAAEFLSLSLCIFFMFFCVVYYKEYERKIEAEHKEEIIRITADQQAKEVETIRKSNLETSLLRHDMRLLLGSLSLCIERGDKEQAMKMISGFSNQVDAASVHRYCNNDTVNYVIANFEGICKEKNIDFVGTVELDEVSVDEIMFSSIISNALENAINAQETVPASERSIKLMLKKSDGKLLLSVKNAFNNAPVFIEGIPTTDKDGHGYGTQSIRYITEKLGGKYQFSVKNNMFVLRVVL